MNKSDIESILAKEINNVRDNLETHNIDFELLKKHLTVPYKKDFFNPILGCIEQHWVVFDEDKNSEEPGYLIFYSEEDNAFGLGTKTNMKKLQNVGTFVGIYGSFIDTLNSI